MNDENMLILNESNHPHDTEMCACSQGQLAIEVGEPLNIQPLSTRTITLIGNGGMVNGASSVTMTAPIAVGDLPRATPAARFLGWATTPTGNVLNPIIMIDGNATLFARFNATNYDQMTRGELAQELIHRHYGRSLSGRRITLMGEWGGMTDTARTTVYRNLAYTALGRPANRAAQSGGEQPVLIGGTVFLAERLLRAILRVNDRFGNVQVNSLAGGRHSPTSRHYQGRAVDFQSDNFIVRGTHTRYNQIINYIRDNRGFDTTGSYGVSSFLHLEIRD